MATLKQDLQGVAVQYKRRPCTIVQFYMRLMVPGTILYMIIELRDFAIKAPQGPPKLQHTMFASVLRSCTFALYLFRNPLA